MWPAFRHSQNGRNKRSATGRRTLPISGVGLHLARLEELEDRRLLSAVAGGSASEVGPLAALMGSAVAGTPPAASQAAVLAVGSPTIGSIVLTQAQGTRSPVFTTTQQLLVTWAVNDTNPLTSVTFTLDGVLLPDSVFGPFQSNFANTVNFAAVFGPVGVGGHNFNITVIDSGGNSQTANGSFSVVAGRQIAISNVVAAELTTQTGTAAANLQNVITWTVTDANPVTGASLSVDGNLVSTISGPFQTSTVTANFSAVASTLGVGTHTFIINVNDNVGNSTSSTGSFVVLGSPRLAISNVTVASVAGGSPQAGQPSVITWSATDTNTLASETLTVDGNTVTPIFGPFATSTANMVNFSGVLGVLSSGQHNFTIAVTDVAGNRTIRSNSFIVGTGQNITVSNVVVAAATPQGGQPNASQPMVLTWSVTDSNPLTIRTLTIDGTIAANVVGPFTTQIVNTTNFAGTFGPLITGTHSFVIALRDSAGNSTNFTGTFTVLPAAIVISNVVTAATPGGGTPTSDKQTVITWSVTDVNPVTGQTLAVDGTPVTTLFGPFATSNPNTFNSGGLVGPLPAGTHTFTITVVDGFGNTATFNGSFSVQLVGMQITNVAIVPTTGPVNGQLLSNQPLMISWSVSDANATVAATATTSVKIDGVALPNVSGPFATGSPNTFNWSATRGGLTAGQHTFQIQASGSNSDTASLNGTFFVTAAPAVAAAARSETVQQPLLAVTA